MKSFSIISFALFFTSTVVSQAITDEASRQALPVDQSKPACVVTLEIYESLDNFILDFKTEAEIQNTPAEFFNFSIEPLKYEADQNGGLGSHTPLIGAGGTWRYLKLDRGVLKLQIPQKIPSPLGYTVVPRDRSIYRQFKFLSNAPNPSTFYAANACKPGATWLELRHNQPGQVFCTVDNKLYVKDRSTPDNICTTVRGIVRRK